MNQYPAHIAPSAATLCAAPGCIAFATTLGAVARAALAGQNSSATPRPAVSGTDLCTHHHTLFAATLGQLVTDWPDLNRAVLRTPSSELKVRVQTSDVPETGAMWNPSATNAINDIREWTEYLVRVILSDRVMPQSKTELLYPQTNGDRLIGPPQQFILRYSHGLTTHTETRLALAAIKLHHASWLSSYPGLGVEWLTEALSAHRRAYNAIAATGQQRITINATCGVVLEQTELGPILCDGQLYATLRTDGSRKPSEILCGTNPRHRIVRPADGQWLDVLG